MGNRRSRGGARSVGVVLTCLVVLPIAGPSHAADGKWTIELTPIYMDAYGHDPHVLTVHRIDLDPVPPIDESTIVHLDTESGFAYRGSFRYGRGSWGWGVNLLWFVTSQDADGRVASADGPSGTFDAVSFETADRTFTSLDPGEVLFYDVLEDTDLQMWTLDLYAARALTENPDTGVRLVFGVRIGDFDNDYHAVAGRRDVAGSRRDASSNYGALLGPAVGLAGDIRRGRNRIEGYIGQSVILGSAELTGTSSDFTGPFASPTFVDREILRTEQDVAIPITDARLAWTYRVSRNLALGLGVDTSVWRDVPVPPGVVPGVDGTGALHENTVVLFGLAGTLVLTF